MATIQGLVAEGFVTLDDAAVISKSEEGWISVKPVSHSDLVRTVGLGGVLGIVAGGLLGLPVIGIAAGSGLAAKRFFGHDHLDELINTVGQELTPGTAVLALTVSELSDPVTVTDRLKIHQSKMLRAEVPASLQTQIDEATGPG